MKTCRHQITGLWLTSVRYLPIERRILVFLTVDQDPYQFRDRIIKIAQQSEEYILEPTKDPFPSFNDRDFPKEKVLNGLRGQKISLVEQWETSKTLPEAPR
ncbi:hypothetical protein GN244_ATG11021 [Phytophthora infestans]|uniref:Uncharacterized protein n=1 Tax=Phytophthora infestans TaxID=4787 RepID=A0A833T503_PHYIN|nr:hypothetical protein GN244_ATG11021 [Phytophthora infestans]